MKIQKTDKTYNQSGRSMVEMLGVLAVIGVLSVGGIAGYKTAMNHHQANKILSTLDTAMILLDGALRTSDNDKVRVNVNNEMDLEYEEGWVMLRKKGTNDTFEFPFNKEICEILARELDVTKWDYLPHDRFYCGSSLFIPIADGFITSSYYDSLGNWGYINCKLYSSGEFYKGANQTFKRRMQDCDGLTGDTLTFGIGG